MAHSEFEYTRKFETWDALPLSNWIVVRIDGRGFSKLCTKYNFEKPNDKRALDLMNAAATEVVRSLSDVMLAYGQSDEYSFVFHEGTTLFDRRASKLATTVATMFTAEYCMLWPTFFPDKSLRRPWPTFDGRCVCYPKRRILRDYLAWRQADCHVNNLYNTAFWNLVLKTPMENADAEKMLKGTVAAEKNEILFGRFGINYNNELEIYRKGSVIYRARESQEEETMLVNGSAIGSKMKVADPQSKTQLEKERRKKLKAEIVVEHVDIIKDDFWNEHAYILVGRRGSVDDE